MNELTEGQKKSSLRIFLEQFQDFLVIILICSAVVSLFLGEAESAVVIFVVIIVNAVLGTVQTIKAEHSLSSLKELAAPSAKVLRGGIVVEIPSREITVGDEVYLEAGDSVSADGRMLESASLKVDESALTGESLGVDKISDTLEGELPLGDRRNMVYSGSFVTYGRGRYLVTDIGMKTEVGKIAALLKNTSEKKTPLPGKSGSVREKALNHCPDTVCRAFWDAGVEGRKCGRCLFICRSTCSRSDSRGVKLYCNHCACFWNAENGKGRSDCP